MNPATSTLKALMNAVVNVGPISISAAAEPWQTYESGVFSDACGADVDHAIQLVGYGTDTVNTLSRSNQMPVSTRGMFDEKHAVFKINAKHTAHRSMHALLDHISSLATNIKFRC
jgi:hypothetical protein